MANRKKKMAYKIVHWDRVHEPRTKNGQVLRGPLKYFATKIHEGNGREILREEYGPDGEDMAVGFFDRLLQRSAGLPCETRGWILTAHGQCATCAGLAHDYHMTEAQVERRLRMLVFCKWLRMQDFSRRRRTKGEPKANQRFPRNVNEDTNTNTNTETYTPDKPGDSPSPEISTSHSSLSDSPSGFAPKYLKRIGLQLGHALRVDARNKSDAQTIARILQHHHRDGQPAESFVRVCELASDAGLKEGIKIPIAYWQELLKQEGLHHLGRPLSTKRSPA